MFVEKTHPDVLEIVKSCVPEGFELITVETTTEEERLLKVPDADFILVGPTPITAKLLEKAKNVKLVQKTGVGVDKIDLKAAAEMGIPVANTGGTNAIAVAEHTILLILAVYKKLPIAHQSLVEGRWAKWDYRCESYEIHGKIAGIVGMGNIGREVTKRLHGFGANIIYYDMYKLPPEKEVELGIQYVSLDELLKTSDIISLHVTLTEQTYHLIGKRELNLMKKSAILINTARGALVDEVALYEALKERRITAAGLDVFSKEPPDPKDPIFSLDNVVVTPHIGGGTRETIERVYQFSFMNMLRVLQGQEPLNKVN